MKQWESMLRPAFLRPAGDCQHGCRAPAHDACGGPAALCAAGVKPYILAAFDRMRT
jgi:hypothetical protein